VFRLKLTATQFLALRLLNKRARVRLSPASHNLDSLPGKAVLFAIANSTGRFAAAICADSGEHSMLGRSSYWPCTDATVGVIVSSLSDLRAAFASSNKDADILFTPPRKTPLPAQPNIIKFTSNGSRLLVGLISGATAVYDAAALSSLGTDVIKPLHVFPSSTGRPPLDISTNPGDLPDLVAVLYESNGSPDSTLVEILDVQRLQVVGGWQSGGVPETIPSTGERRQ
jgi:nucleoporin NUP159